MGKGVRIGLLAALLLPAGTACGTPPPTTEEIREAYAAHMRADPVHEIGLKARQTPVVIPSQEPVCSSDGDAHFDCRIRVIYETKQARRSEDQTLHIKREGGTWIIESLD